MESGYYPRPKPGTKTARVWDIADAITNEKGRLASRKEVEQGVLDDGGNRNTAQTQYTYWRAQSDTSAQSTAESLSSADVFQIQVREAGRVVVPVEIRNALKIVDGDSLTARIVDGEIRIMPLSTAIKKAQELVRQYVPAGTGLVDSLIAERKAEGRE